MRRELSWCIVAALVARFATCWRLATWRVHLLHPAFSVRLLTREDVATDGNAWLAHYSPACVPTVQPSSPDDGRSNGSWMPAHGARPPTHLPWSSGAAAPKTGLPGCPCNRNRVGSHWNGDGIDAAPEAPLARPACLP